MGVHERRRIEPTTYHPDDGNLSADRRRRGLMMPRRLVTHGRVAMSSTVRTSPTVGFDSETTASQSSRHRSAYVGSVR